MYLPQYLTITIVVSTAAPRLWSSSLQEVKLIFYPGVWTRLSDPASHRWNTESEKQNFTEKVVANAAFDR